MYKKLTAVLLISTLLGCTDEQPEDKNIMNLQNSDGSTLINIDLAKKTIEIQLLSDKKPITVQGQITENDIAGLNSDTEIGYLAFKMGSNALGIPTKISIQAQGTEYICVECPDSLKKLKRL